MGSGYTNCRCRDCFEITISSDTNALEFCSECEDAGCEDDSECCAEGAYGSDDEDEAKSEQEYRAREQAQFQATKKGGW